MKKKITAILLIAVMLITLIPSTAFAATSGSCGKNAKWKITGDTLTISGKGPMKDYTAKKLPPWFNNQNIENIIIKEGITYIGEYAFAGFLNVRSVEFPEGVTKIGSEAFAYCERLNTIYVPKSMKVIADYAFRDCTSLSETYYASDNDDFRAINMGAGNRWIITGDIYYTCEHLKPEYITEVIPPSCLMPGLYRCSRCNQTFRDGEMLPHVEEEVKGYDATCTASGLTDGTKCHSCGNVINQQTTIPAKGHQGEWTITKPATETEKGIKTRTCTVCGEVETVEYSLYKKGDVNKDGSVDAKDATQILRFVNGKASSLDSMDDAEKLAIGDVNADDTVDAKDATQILRYVNGKASALDNIQ